MYNMFLVLLVCIATMIGSLIATPIFKKITIKEKRKSFSEASSFEPKQRKEMPTMGGVAIFIPFYLALFFLLPVPHSQLIPIFLGSLIVLITGMLDDWLDLSPSLKILGILAGAAVTYFMGDIALETMTFPFVGVVEFRSWDLPFTLLWILGFSNAMNLIDGLDGLASGISIIALMTMGIIGFFFLTIEEVSISVMIFVLAAAIAGFWPYNFQPASIFLGDTGALFIGFMIGIFSLQGLKNATLISLILPVVILGIPITDTLFAIIRRRLNKQSLKTRDMHHIHNRLMSLGLSHRQTVLAIYCVSAIFSVIAMLYNFSTFWGWVFITIGVILGVELFVEIIGLVGENRRPLLKLLRQFGERLNNNKM